MLLSDALSEFRKAENNPWHQFILLKLHRNEINFADVCQCVSYPKRGRWIQASLYQLHLREKYGFVFIPGIIIHPEWFDLNQHNYRSKHTHRIPLQCSHSDHIWRWLGHIHLVTTQHVVGHIEGPLIYHLWRWKDILIWITIVSYKTCEAILLL